MTDTDADTPLARAYNRALALEKAGKHAEAAAAYVEVLALDPDDHGGAAVRLAAMGQGAVPERAPQAYVQTLFDQQAEAFEEILVDRLGYGVPGMMRDLVAPLAPFVRVLDLGCGTGLAGELLRPVSGYLAGVDLSEGMLGLADDKDVYDDLYLGDVVEFLVAEDEEEGAPFDLIVATDVFPYLGEVEGLVAGAARNLEPGGHFVFSTETLPEETLAGRNFMVGPHQRFAHAEPHLRSVLAASGFEVVSVDPITVRHEMGAPVPGHLVLARLGAA